MPDEPQTILNIALPATDWPVINAGLLKLPGEICLPVWNRLQLALAEAQKPHVVSLRGENDG